MNHKKEVHRYIAIGITILGAIYLCFYLFSPPIAPIDFVERLRLAAKSLGFLALPLLMGVGYTVLIRYRDPGLIRGFTATPSATLAGSLAYNSNTLEQTVLHTLTLIALCATVPAQLLPFASAQVTAFLIGRALFVIGYRRHPTRRLIGFVVSYYPVLVASALSCSFALVGMI